MTDKIIFKAIVGSRSYGTNLPTSDTDYKGVYMQPTNDLISFGYKEQFEVGKDETYYEVRRFLQLLQSANPSVLELLFTPDDCIIQTSPQFELIKSFRDKFLTKKCLKSFGGYAVQQIVKAKSLDKKKNWENGGFFSVRKNLIDFVYLVNGHNAPTPIKSMGFSEETEKNLLFTSISGFKNFFKLHLCPGKEGGIKFDSTNSLITSQVDEKDTLVSSVVFYDKDEYSQYHKRYKEYQEWLMSRNTDRYVKTQGSKTLDGKNLLHCRRLIDMAMEIASGQGLNVRRPNVDFLLSIRKGEVELEDIISQAEEDIKKLDVLFESSNLPESCDEEFVKNLLLQVRYYDVL